MLDAAVQDAFCRVTQSWDRCRRTNSTSCSRRRPSSKAPARAVMFDEYEDCRGFGLLLSGVMRIAKAARSRRKLHLYDVSQGDSCILTSGCILGAISLQRSRNGGCRRRDGDADPCRLSPGFHQNRGLPRSDLRPVLGAYGRNVRARVRSRLPAARPATGGRADREGQLDSHDA
jgi:hypothetical protein